MELLQYWNPIRKRLWLIALLICIALAAASFYVMRQPVQYRAHVSLYAYPEALGAALDFRTATEMLPANSSYVNYITSTSFLQPLIQKLQEENLSSIPSESSLGGAIIAHYNNAPEFRIVVTHANPQVAQAAANAMAEVIIEANEARLTREMEILLSAQASTERVQEIDRLRETIHLLLAELEHYNDQIQTLEQQLEVLSSGPQFSDTDARIVQARDDLLRFRGARLELLPQLAAAQQALLAEMRRTNEQVDTIAVLNPASLPEEPLPRNMLQPILAAMAAAMGLGIALAIGWDYLDASVKSPEALDRVYGIPTLGAIGQVKGLGAKSPQSENLVMLHAPQTPIAETIRVLRTAVAMSAIHKPIRSLLVTSARLGEGKTFISANLAVSIAQTGKQVVLVDADLRRPQVHKIFGARLEPGFTNLLVDRNLKLADVLQSTPVSNLRVLSCGTVPPNPAELLSSEQAAAWMQELSEAADVVIYDSSPASTVTDAVILAPRVDGVIQVVSARGTRVDLVQRCKDLLERAGGWVIGAVLNRVATPDLGYYSNYYHNDGYALDGNATWGQLAFPAQVATQSRGAVPAEGAPVPERGKGHSSSSQALATPANGNPLVRRRQGQEGRPE